MNKILIIENEKEVNDLIKFELESQGYQCECESDGELAANCIENKKYDLILLGVIVPKIDRYELLKYIKQIDKEIPIIFITERSHTKDMIKALKNRSR